MSLRSTLGRVPGLRAGRREALRAKAALEAEAHRAKEAITARAARAVTFEKLPPSIAVGLAYEVMLGWKPPLEAIEGQVTSIENGDLSRREIVGMLRGSDAFNTTSPFTGQLLGHSIHAGRCQFIRSLPRADRILDLGGTHQHRDVGALVGLGYPYRFDELVIVDLPSDDRHDIYRGTDRLTEVESPLGPVRYRYHSMTDLSGYEDASFGLVYSGQSIEHVTREEGASVLAQVHRVLRPGGYLAIDTPNARVTRLQQEEFIDPDHKIEYELEGLTDMVRSAGFVDIVTMGLNYAGTSVDSGKFDQESVAQHPGLFSDAADCYILCVTCRKPS